MTQMHSLQNKLRLTPVWISLVWTLLLGGAAYWYAQEERHNALHAAEIEAITSINKDIVFRNWVSKQGGIYAPISEHLQPNPYLEIKDRDITLENGKKLTLVNPAYMSRQVFELGFSQMGMRGHITSLNPIRKENAPDSWEEKILKRFESNPTIQTEEQTLNGQRYLRSMKPLIADQSCISCHAKQNYKVGDIRGGISESVLLDPFLALSELSISHLWLTYFLLWLVGLSGIIFAFYKIYREQSNIFQLNRLTAVGTLASGLAHEINNPLTVLLGNLETATAAIEGRPEFETLRTQIKKAERASWRINNIINRINDFAEEPDLTHTKVDLNEIIPKAISLTQTILDTTGVRFDTHFSKVPATINGNESQISQILLNIFSNSTFAIQQTKKEGLVTISTKTMLRSIELVIRDNGAGIPKSKIDMIFDPFFTTKDPDKGTGMGLSLTHAMLRTLGATIQAESTEGKETAVRILFPRTK